MRVALAGLMMAVALWLAPAAMGKTYVLLTGVGTYEDPKINDLACLDADIAMMRTTLMEALGPAGVEIAILTNRQATAPSIQHAFKAHLLDKAGPGDTLLFYFSGHGSQVTDMDGDEEDGKDEILVPFGASWANPASYILDDQLHQWLESSRAGQTVVILDSCHSGTGTRSLLGAFEKRCDLGFDGVTKSAFAFRPRQRNGFQALKPGGAGKKVLVAACEANETALGLSTGSLLTAELCKEIKADASAPMGEIVERARARVAREAKARQHKQTPQIEGAGAVSLVGRPGAPARPATELPRSVERGLSVQAPRTRPTPTVAPSAPRQTAPAPTGIPQAPRIPESYELFPVEMEIVDLATGLSVVGREVAAGTRLQVRLISKRDAHLRLYHFDALQRSTLIFPNEYQPEGRVTANSQLVVPSAAETFDLVVTDDPTGVEQIMAVCSTTPFHDSVGSPLKDTPFFGVAPLRPSQAITRGLAVTGRASPTTPATGRISLPETIPTKQTEIGYSSRSYKVVGQAN